MKAIIGKVFGGLFGGNIKFFTIAALVGGIAFLGWHYPNRISVAKDRKEEIKELKGQIKTKDATIKTLNGRMGEDSVMYVKNVEIFQTNILHLNNRNKQTLESMEALRQELRSCEQGLDCWEKPFLGKWRKVKCRDSE